MSEYAPIEIMRGSLDFSRLPNTRIGLWHFAPRWPDHPKARVTATKLASEIKQAYMATDPLSFFILWMPASYLHRTSFDPLSMAKPWHCFSTIISGAQKPTIGYVYATNPSIRGWGNTVIFDNEGRGPTSSITVKFLLDRLNFDGAILDPYASQTAKLAVWCKRWNIPYWGYIRGKKSHASARRILKQIELPGIQQSLLKEGKENG